MSGLCGGCCRRKGRGDAAYACGAHPKRLTYAEKCTRADAPPPPPVVDAKPVVRTTARALLLGMGADELLAGYARHRTAFKRGGLEELEREVGVDVSRIATRNLGRDDRVTAAWGREAVRRLLRVAAPLAEGHVDQVDGRVRRQRVVREPREDHRVEAARKQDRDFS